MEDAMQFKEGFGWKACYDEERKLYTAQRWSSDLYEINKEIYNQLSEELSSGEAGRLISSGRHLYMDVNDRCRPPYTVVFDADYKELCPWADVIHSGPDWQDEMVDAAVELFDSEADNREQRRKKREEREKKQAEEGK